MRARSKCKTQKKRERARNELIERRSGKKRSLQKATKTKISFKKQLMLASPGRNACAVMAKRAYGGWHANKSTRYLAQIECHRRIVYRIEYTRNGGACNEIVTHSNCAHINSHSGACSARRDRKKERPVQTTTSQIKCFMFATALRDRRLSFGRPRNLCSLCAWCMMRLPHQTQFTF